MLPVSVLTVLAAGAVAVGDAGVARSSSPPPQCGAAPSGTSKDFAYTSAKPQTFRIPRDVHFLDVHMSGGHGGKDSSTADGGVGGMITGVRQVTPGTCLLVYVGQRGNGSSGGWGWGRGGSHGTAGGGSDDDAGSGAAGGGSSAIVRATTPLLVAGGGGGGGGDSGDGYYGGKGGAGTGAPGIDPFHGTVCGGCSGKPGGANGHSSSRYAGGGGGGGGATAKQGGGAGGKADGDGGGGGGGASYTSGYFYGQVTGSTRSCPYRETPSTCNGDVAIDWDVDPVTITAIGKTQTVYPRSRVPLNLEVGVGAGFALQGVSVRFSVPASGASGYFTDPKAPSKHLTSYTVTTDGGGGATAPMLTTNATTGTWAVTATTDGARPLRIPVNTVLPPSRTAVSSSVSPSYAGAPVTFTAHVAVTAPGRLTGKVAFTDDGNRIGAPLAVAADGTATSSPVTLPAGDHAIKASFDGTSGGAAASSGQITLTVRRIPTATTLTIEPQPSQTGGVVTLAAHVSQLAGTPGTPGGSVAFRVDGQDVGQAPLGPEGTATLAGIPINGLGDHTVTATYAGSDSFTASTGAATQAVGPDATATTVALSHNPSVYGQPLDAIATVRGAAPTSPTGTVAFIEDGGQYCTRTLTPAAGSTSTAQCDVAGLVQPGTHPINVVYTPDSDSFDPSRGSVAAHVTAARTRTTVTSTAGRLVYGQELRLRAQVTPVAPGFGNPGGTVQFTVDGKPAGAPVPLGAGGVAIAPANLPRLGAGAHAFGAAYRQGFAKRFQVSSAHGALRVLPAPTVVKLVSDRNPSPFGTTVRLTAVVSSSVAGASTPAGSVRFTVPGASSPNAPVALLHGRATASASQLRTGESPIVVVYGGDANHAPSRATLRQVVDPSGSGPPVRPNPRISGVALTHTRFTLSGTARGRRPPVGTKLRYTLSAPATVTVRISQRRAGRLRPRVTLTRHLRSAGRHTLALTATLRRRHLPAGRYQLAVAVKGASTGQVRVRRFAILGRR